MRLLFKSYRIDGDLRVSRADPGFSLADGRLQLHLGRSQGRQRGAAIPVDLENLEVVESC